MSAFAASARNASRPASECRSSRALRLPRPQTRSPVLEADRPRRPKRGCGSRARRCRRAASWSWARQCPTRGRGRAVHRTLQASPTPVFEQTARPAPCISSHTNYYVKCERRERPSAAADRDRRQRCVLGRRRRAAPRGPTLRRVRTAPPPAAPDVPALPLVVDRGGRALRPRHALQLFRAAPSPASGVRLPGARRARRPRRRRADGLEPRRASNRTTSASACRSRSTSKRRTAGPISRSFGPEPTPGHEGEPRQRRRDRRHRQHRVLAPRRPHRAAARVRIDHRGTCRRGHRRERRRRPRQLHRRPGRRDRARPLDRVSPRSRGRAASPTAAADRWACSCTPRPRSRAVRRMSSSRTAPFALARAPLGSAAKTAPSPTSAHSGTTAMQWCMPFGVLTPASWMSLNATRYMHTYDVTSADFGRAVVQLREYAAANPRRGASSVRSRSPTTRSPDGSPSRPSGSSTAARRPTAPWRS